MHECECPGDDADLEAVMIAASGGGEGANGQHPSLHDMTYYMLASGVTIA